MKEKLFISAFLLVFASYALHAQSGKIFRGVISDSITGERIIGATIGEYDKDNRIITGAITDVDGNYVMNYVDPDHIFRISYIGYKTKDFHINGREVINILIASQSIQMDEVTIVAESTLNPLTGVARRDNTGSSVRVDMSAINNIGVTSAGEALQGMISGVDIMSASGDPGSGTSIVIRGLTSLGGAKPLIVVDNIPQTVHGIDDFEFAFADQEDIGELVSISPQDIKSIEVLKDASTTAVWGSKGANGVLLIETHRGSRGKTKFEYMGKYTLNIQPPAIPMLNGDEYITLQLDALHAQNPYFSLPSEIAYDRTYSEFNNYAANTDWLAALTRPGFINEQNFKLAGGGDKTSYFASVNYHNNTGTTINTSLNRLSTRLNLDYDISDKIRISVNFNFTNSFKEDNMSVEYDEVNHRSRKVREMAYIKAPNMSIWEYDAEGELTGEYFTPNNSYQGNGMAYYNPVAIADQSINDRQQNQMQNSFVLRYKLLPWLTFNQTISLAYTGTKSNQFLPRTALGVNWLDEDNNFAAESNSTSTNSLYRTQFFLRPRIKDRKHSFSTTLMMENEDLSSESTTIQGDNFASVALSDPATLSVMRSLRSNGSQVRNIGFLGNINYKFKDRYIFAFNTRLDGSSKFGVNNRWGLFPSASFGWRFSQENWMQNLPWLSDSKIRISWGEAGRQPRSAYDRHAIFSPEGTYMNQAVIVATQVQLDNLRWEKKTSVNLGLDLGLLKGKINITVDLYKDKIDDLLWTKYDIPTVSGYTRLRYFNGGQMSNKGWEFNTNAVILRKNDLTWSINGNISQNFNVFQEFPDNFVNEVDESLGNGKYPVKANIDQPIGSFYGLRYLGVWPSDESVQATTANGEVLRDLEGNPVRLSYGLGEYYFAGGDAIYEDINHDGIIDINDVVYLGDSNPEFNGGFGSRLSWKNFRISAQLHFRTGFEIVNGVAIQTEGMRDRNNQSRAVLHRWTYQGQDEPDLLPRAYMNHPANNLGSSRYVESGSFLRLNNVNFSYGLPKKLCNSMKISSFDISITMRKLLTITNYTGQDPEVPQDPDNPFWFGTDKARTPPPRVYTISMVLEF